MLTILFLTTLLILAASVVALISIGHLHLRLSGLQAQIAEAYQETQFQARTTRKMIREDFDTKILPTIGWKPAPPTDLETAMAALSRGEEPALDWSRFKLKGKA